MPSQNEAAANLRVKTIVRDAGKLLYSQIPNSVLSKQGKTSLTGIFEGTPQNTVTRSRGYLVPGPNTPAASIDRVLGTRANTYLESLKNSKRI